MVVRMTEDGRETLRKSKVEKGEDNGKANECPKADGVVI